MKKSTLLFSLGFAGALFFCGSFMLKTMTKTDARKEHKTEAQIAEEYVKLSNFFHTNMETGRVDFMDYMNAVKQAQALRSMGSRAGSLNLNWEEMGPDNVGGRTRSILVDKQNTNLIFAGAASGGLWMSEDGGDNWKLSTAWRDAAGGSIFNAIMSITQSNDGTLYIGTGEGFAGSAPGNGVYKSTDHGTTWTHLASTDIINPLNPNFGERWSVVNKVSVSPTDANHVFAALANYGLVESKDGGATWAKPAAISSNNNSGDVCFGIDDNLVYAVINGNKVWRSNDGGVTWTNLTASAPLSLYLSPASRTQIAIAPSDNNYVYLSANGPGAGCLTGVFRTTDGGISWSTLLSGGSTTDPFAQPGGGSGCQGFYDHAIAVVPNDRTKIYIAGITLWSYSEGLSWKRSDKLGTEGASYDSPHYIHADKHCIVFDPTNPERMFVGHDGGVSRTINANSGFPTPAFKSIDKNYSVTQFYAMGAGRKGDMIAGSQDNGTSYIDFNGNTSKARKESRGGDGFFCDISHLVSTVMFASVYTGDMERSGNKGSSYATFFDNNIDNDGDGEPGTNPGGSAFRTFGLLAETEDAVTSTKQSKYVNYISTYKNSTSAPILSGSVVVVTNPAGVKFNYTLPSDLAPDSIAIIAQSIASGSEISITSATGTTFLHTLVSTLAAGDSIFITDRLESRFFLGTNAGLFTGSGRVGLWVCTNPLNVSQSPRWFPIPGISGEVYALAQSADANVMYASSGSTLWRISGFNTATYNYAPALSSGVPGSSISGLTVTACSVPTSRWISGIAVDPNDDRHVLLARLGYSTAGGNVVKSTDGINFTDISGSLPNMPAYDVVIDASNRDNYIIGTELGFWTSSDGGTNWVEENNGVGWVPVYRLRQLPLYEKGCMVIYAGTFGRGMWRTTTRTNVGCKTNVGIEERAQTALSPTATLSIFPNPLTDNGNVSFDLNEASKVDISVFSLTGRLISKQTINGFAGKNTAEFNMENQAAGSYIIAVKAGNSDTRSKLFIKK